MTRLPVHSSFAVFASANRAKKATFLRKSGYPAALAFAGGVNMWPFPQRYAITSGDSGC
jgi:hypothetical protein